MSCVDTEELVEAGINHVLTQYRESPKLLHMIRTYMRKVAEVHAAICDLPSHFDLQTAVGDQLTLIGKRMGFPRCHCVCDVQPVYGIVCEGFPSTRPIIGPCEVGSWEGCGEDGISEICIEDDDIYRRLLISRSYQMQSRYSLEDLTGAIQAIYGPQAAVLDSGHGRVVLAPFRELTTIETAILQVIPRVLPIAPGIVSRWHFGTRLVAGFGAGWGGPCEEWEGGAALATEEGEILVTEDGIEIWTGTVGVEMMCETDLKPYSC